MEGDFRHLNVSRLCIFGNDLINPSTRKINDHWLPERQDQHQNIVTAVNAEYSSMYGKYSRKDVSVGHIHLEVSEDGILIQLIKNDNVFSHISNGKTTIGFKHQIEKGIYYILTHTSNAILEIDTSIHTSWENTNKCGSIIKKYILVKRKSRT